MGKPVNEMLSSPAILQVEHLTKVFGSGPTAVTAVRDVSLTIEPGEVVLIMGPSGSGKSTLLTMLGILLQPTQGSISLQGTVISDLSEWELLAIRLHRFGFIFQDFILLSTLTALENVALVACLAGASWSDSCRKGTALLSHFGLADCLDHTPDQLSDGEKQLVAIARALVNDAAVIFADEPTANLDSQIGLDVMRLLQRISREGGRSVVIMSQDHRIKGIADRVLWLEDGELKAMENVAHDPVCGIAVDREHAVIAEWSGNSYAFCSRGCRDDFFEEPARFASGPGSDLWAEAPS